MKKLLITALLLFTPIVAFADVQTNFWKLLGGTLQPLLTTWSLTVGQLGGNGTRCVHVNNSGLFSVASADCGSGSGGSSIATTSDIAASGVAYFTSTIPSILGSVATGTVSSANSALTVTASRYVLGGNLSLTIASTSNNLFTGTAGQILAYLNGGWTGTATTTFNSPLTYSGGSVSCATCTVGGLTSYDPFTHPASPNNTDSATTSPHFGIGTTTPFSALSVSTAVQQDGTIPLFTVGSTTSATLFTILGNAKTGIGTSSPSAKLSIVADTTGFANSGRAFVIYNGSIEAVLINNSGRINAKGFNTNLNSGNYAINGQTVLAANSSGNEGTPLDNTFVGVSSGGLAAGATAFDNTFVGFEAGLGADTNTQGSTVVGSQAGIVAGLGIANSLFGYFAGEDVIGAHNTMIGVDTGLASQASNENNLLLLGFDADITASAGIANSIVLNSSGTTLAATASNQLRIGPQITATGINASGVQFGIGTTSPFSNLSVSSTGQLAATNSLFAVASTTNSTLFNVLANGNVGIGTSSPTSLFSIGTAGNAFRVDTTGTAKEGIWNGTAIAIGFGGTGLSSLTANNIIYANDAGTAFAQIATSSLNLGVSGGGTGLTSFTANRVFYSNDAGTGIAQVATSTLTASTGLSYSGTMGALVGGASGNLTVNTSQNITTLSNLTNNGYVFTSGGGGTLNASVFSANTIPYVNGAGTSIAQIATSSLNLGISGGGTATTTMYNGGVNFYNSTLGTISQGTAQADFFYDVANKRLGLSSSSPQSTLSVVGNGWFHGSSFLFENFNCPPGSAAAIALQVCGSDNTTAGVQLGTANRNVGTSAYNGYFLNNNLADATITHYGFIGLNSSTYSDTTFGTALAVKNQLNITDTDGPITFISATSTNALVPTFINFVIGGAATTNEAMRINFGGNVGIGTTTPFAGLSVVNSATGIFAVASSTTLGSEKAIFEVDNTGHMSAGGRPPAVSTCTGFSLTAGGTDMAGNVAMTAGTTCSLNFANTWAVRAPVCVVTANNALVDIRISTLSTTQLGITTSANITNWTYMCLGSR